MKCNYVTIYEGLPNTKFSCFVFVEKSSSKGDILYAGNDDGRLYFFVVSKHSTVNRQEELNPGEVGGPDHKSTITCMMHSKHPSLASSLILDKGGLLFTGSKDRTLKIWQPAGTFKPLIQTLYGHSGQISGVCDGNDGTILSCSLDGTIRIWKPQKGRELMLKPFFECINVISVCKDEGEWLTGIVVNHFNHWSCFVSNSLGDILVYEKSNVSLFGSSIVGVGTVEATASVTVTPQSSLHHSIVGSTNSAPYLSIMDTYLRVHDLGITSLFVETDANLLVTTSFDGTSKILDASCGYAMFTLRNVHACVYTGVAWSAQLSSFYLCDELGYVEVFNVFREKTVDVLLLLPPSIRMDKARREGILNSHREPMTTAVSLFNQGNGTILTLFPNGIPSPQPGSSSHCSSAVVAWRLTEDVTCTEFEGHEGAVVALAVPPPPSSSMLHSAESKTTMNAPLLPSSPHKSTALEAAGMSPNAFAAMHPSSGGPLSPILHQMQTMSREEAHFFTLGQQDMTIRCWDELDKSESFQFRLKEKSEPTVLCVLWSLNMLAVGFEGGSICLMNNDSGSRVPSRALKETISSLIEGQRFAPNSGRGTLIGADFSGKLAVWDITNGYKVSSTVFQGFHDAEDPSVLSLAFHHPSTTVFSGGSDGTIRYWQMNNTISSADFQVKTLNIGSDEGQSAERVSVKDLLQQAKEAGIIYIPRQKQVSSLYCTDDFLLSGDESGEMRLWLVVHARTGHQEDSNGATGDKGHKVDVEKNRGLDPPPIRGLQLLVRWPTPFFTAIHISSTNATCSLFQASNSDCFIAQTRGHNKTTVWQINVHHAENENVRKISMRGDEKLKQLINVEQEKLAKEKDLYAFHEKLAQREPEFYAISPDAYGSVGLYSLGKTKKRTMGAVLTKALSSGHTEPPGSHAVPTAGKVAAAPAEATAVSAVHIPRRLSIVERLKSGLGAARGEQHSLSSVSLSPASGQRKLSFAAPANAASTDRNAGPATSIRSITSATVERRRGSVSGGNKEPIGAEAFSTTGKILANVKADVVSSTVVHHPEKDIHSLCLTGSRRADAPPDVLFIATHQGTVLRFKLSISANRMSANTSAGMRAREAKKNFKRILMGTNMGVGALHRASNKERAELMSEKPIFSKKSLGLKPSKSLRSIESVASIGSENSTVTEATPTSHH